LKIFVVDDDLISRMALIDAINSVGGDVFDLVEYESGDDAWRALQGKGVPPMLICCDIRMPGISGLELLEKVRAKSETKDLPFVLISSANDAETIKKAVASGVSGFIVKPFAHDDAKTRMSKALNLARHKSIESPAETMTRLKLSLERYRAYLS
jgi:two-component system chemotaxis response regulator CheY